MRVGCLVVAPAAHAEAQARTQGGQCRLSGQPPITRRWLRGQADPRCSGQIAFGAAVVDRSLQDSRFPAHRPGCLASGTGVGPAEGCIDRVKEDFSIRTQTRKKSFSGHLRATLYALPQAIDYRRQSGIGTTTTNRSRGDTATDPTRRAGDKVLADAPTPVTHIGATARTSELGVRIRERHRGRR